MGRKPITYGAGLGELAKKLEEITTLSNIEAFMISCSHLHEGEPDLTIFPNSPSRSSALINRPNIPEIQEREKGEDDLPSWDPSLDSYSEQQLQRLLNYLETKSSKIDHKIKFLEQGNAGIISMTQAGESSDIKVNGSGPSNMKYQDKPQPLIADTITNDSNIVNVHPSGPSNIKEPMTAGDMAVSISLADQPSNIEADDAMTPTFTFEEIQFLRAGIVDDDYPGSST